jgi:hypothetical protein
MSEVPLEEAAVKALGIPEIEMEAFVDGSGEPMIRLKFNGQEVVASLFRARGWALEVFMLSEQAMTEAFIRKYFGKAKDQAKAAAIVAHMLPAMTEARKQELGKFATDMLRLGESI